MIIDGYVRLSRDDNKKNYSSIANQKLIIEKYAVDHGMTIRHIYEDDGVSGYSFQRPAFQDMMAHLDTIQIIVAKDLSRIGRHNAKVLLFLEEMEEMGKRIILIDDNYDSSRTEDDDMIGIKTWDNERHVKKTSRQVKRIKHMEQKDGTLICKPPFGYTRHPLNKQLVVIEEEEAAILHLEKEIYLRGNGIRKTAELLSRQQIPTPSMMEKERYESLGLPYHRQVADQWSFGMVKDTLFNDYNNGILRTHKRERVTINGKDKKVPKPEQYVFPNHHPKIFDDQTMQLLYETKELRTRSHYRGQRTHDNLFSGCLYCKDCGQKLTAINRPGRARYYICGTYNKKGLQFCSHSHLVTEEALSNAVLAYLTLCYDCLKDRLQSFDYSYAAPRVYTASDRKRRIELELEKEKNELKQLITQKIRDLAATPSSNSILCDSYDSLLQDKTAQISRLSQSLQDFADDAKASHSQTSRRLLPADIMQRILTNKELTPADIRTLVQKVIVDQEGNADIYLKYGLENLASHEFRNVSNEDEVHVFADILDLLVANTTGYTSAKYLTEQLKALGYLMHKKKLLPYMELLLNLGFLAKTELYHKPYQIIASKQQLQDGKTYFSPTDSLPI